jgi:hypothetical protein
LRLWGNAQEDGGCNNTWLARVFTGLSVLAKLMYNSKFTGVYESYNVIFLVFYSEVGYQLITGVAQPITTGKLWGQRYSEMISEMFFKL